MTFGETQRFRSGWLWLVVGPVAALAWLGGYRQLVRGLPFGARPMTDEGMVAAWLMAGVALPALLAVANLRTEVREDGVHLRLFPFHLRWRHWPFELIDQVETRRYSPVGEYGGWGIRIGRSGVAYNVRGNRGVQLVLTTGERILIGSQRPAVLAEAIRAGVRRTREG